MSESLKVFLPSGRQRNGKAACVCICIVSCPNRWHHKMGPRPIKGAFTRNEIQPDF